MHIALVAHNIRRGDGQGRVNLEIVKHALARGHQCTLLADDVDSELTDAGANWVPIHAKVPRPNLFKVYGFARRADAELRRTSQAFDVIVGNGYTLNHPHQVNVCHFVHGTWRKSEYHVSRREKNANAAYQWTYSKLNAVWEKRAFDHARCVVAISRLTQNELKKIGVQESKIRLIPNGVDLNEFAPSIVERSELGLPVDVPLALFIGDIKSPRKNLDTVMNALSQIPSLHLAVVGEAAGSPFPDMARALGVSDRVHFLGFRRDIAKLLPAVDVFVFPSRYETFGLVVLEALASGVPVVTASTVGASELMTPACGSVLLDPNRVDDLVQAIQQQLVQDPGARQQTRQAARRVAEKYSWTNMAQAYLDLFEELRR